MPPTDETIEFIPMSFKDFTPLWPRIILTAVLTFGLGMGLPVSKAFEGVDTNQWERRPDRASTSEVEG